MSKQEEFEKPSFVYEVQHSLIPAIIAFLGGMASSLLAGVSTELVVIAWILTGILVGVSRYIMDLLWSCWWAKKNKNKSLTGKWYVISKNIKFFPPYISYGDCELRHSSKNKSIIYMTVFRSRNLLKESGFNGSGEFVFNFSDNTIKGKYEIKGFPVTSDGNQELTITDFASDGSPCGLDGDFYVHISQTQMDNALRPHFGKVYAFKDEKKAQEKLVSIIDETIKNLKNKFKITPKDLATFESMFDNNPKMKSLFDSFFGSKRDRVRQAIKEQDIQAMIKKLETEREKFSANL